MDMRISGSGQITPGEYENIRISGSGRLSGLVRCTSFHASGSAHGDEIDCKKEMKVSGSCGFNKDIRCSSLGVSGSFSCGGNVTAWERLNCSGAAKVEGNIKCGELQASGGIHVGSDVEAETVKISGRINCGGLLNAEEIHISSSGSMEIGSIGEARLSSASIRVPSESSGCRCCPPSYTFPAAVSGLKTPSKQIPSRWKM